MEAMGRATLAMDDIFEKEGLYVDPAMVAAAVQEATREKREAGTQFDEEGLAESVTDSAKVSRCHASPPPRLPLQSRRGSSGAPLLAPHRSALLTLQGSDLRRDACRHP